MRRRKKYSLSRHQKILPDGTRLHRIKAKKNLPTINVRSGELGGWVEGYHNLSQNGTCWIFDEATVYDRAFICDDAQVRDNASVFDKAIIQNNAEISNDVCVFGNAHISSHAHIKDNVIVYDNVVISGFTVVSGTIVMNGNSAIYHNAYIATPADLERHLAKTSIEKLSEHEIHRYNPPNNTSSPITNDDLPFY